MSIRSFAFNGFDLAPYLQVMNVSRSISSERHIEQENISGRDGSIARVAGVNPLEVTIECALKARSVMDVTEARHALASILVANEPKKLILPDERNGYLLALYTGGAEISRNANRPTVKLKFLCADPFVYGRHRKAELTTATKAICAGGNYKSYPKITAQVQAGSAWQIQDTDTGKFIRVYANFVAGQKLEIDTAISRCLINGTDHAVALESHFEDFYLEGTKHLSVLSGTAMIEWVERWV